MGKIFENSINIAKGVIDDRLLRKKYMSEDNIRYLLFYSILKGTNFQINPNVINLEKKYSQLNSENIKYLTNPSGFELDAQIEDLISKERDVIEIKYHKKSKSLSDTTSKLGEIFNDINRLICIDNNDRYLFYLTDSVMNDYLTSSRAPLCIKEFYELNNKSEIKLNDCLNSKNNTKHKTFHDKAYRSIISSSEFDKYANNFKIMSLLDMNDGILSEQHYLRVYKIIK